MAGEAEPGADLDQTPDVDEGTAADAVAPLLIEPDQGWIADDEAAVVADEAVGDVGSLSAEELAINVLSEDEAPGLTWDESPGYLDDVAGDAPPGAGGDLSSSADL